VISSKLSDLSWELKKHLTSSDHINIKMLKTTQLLQIKILLRMIYQSIFSTLANDIVGTDALLLTEEDLCNHASVR